MEKHFGALTNTCMWFLFLTRKKKKKGHWQHTNLDVDNGANQYVEYLMYIL